MSPSAGIESHPTTDPSGLILQDRPDPLLTANLYLRGRLDFLIQHVLVPFWAELPETAHSLWFLRYARGGEHLKIRIHGPESLRSAMASSLGDRARLFLSGPGEPASAQARSLAPPIDPEDAEEHADSQILWTTYRRSPVVFGPQPLIADDRYVALFTRCLGSGCSLILPAFDAGPPCYNRRQTVLLSLLASGLGILLPSHVERAAYFAYHRNWLIRLLVFKRNLGERKAHDILDRYEAAAGNQATIRTLVRLDHQVANDGDGDSFWVSSLRELRNFLRFEGPERSFDPFSNEPLFPILLKFFHCLANQVGLGTLNEGLAHHLMFRTLNPEETTSFSLLPG